MPRPRLTRALLVRALALATLCLVAIAPAVTGSHGSAGAADRRSLAPSPTAIVGYSSKADLSRALQRHPGLVLRTIPALGVAEVLPRA